MSNLLSIKGITKQFGSNKVLRGIDLEINQGDILSLIGGNGAGKSTLMKIIMGIYQPDEGSVFVEGERIHSFKPSSALAKGIYMVPQEPLLFPNMSVRENILIGFKENKTMLYQRLLATIKEINWKFDLGRRANSLSIAEQQLVELLRGLMRESKILILDEPTSSLSFEEVESLFKVIDRLKNKGIGIIYITHRLNEVFRISTHIAIMRDGFITVQGKASDFDKQTLIKGLLPPNVNETQEYSGRNTDIDYKELKPVFRLEKYSGYGFDNINLEVYPGEILGIAGLVGAGRTELATTIFGKERVLSGKAYLGNKDITGISAKEAISFGINYVPEDRRLNGLFPISSVTANITSALLAERKLGTFLLNRKKEAEITQKYINDFRIKVTGHRQEAGSLSGGNQQKLIIGRILSTSPKLIILDEPTRGIDAAARGDVYSIIKELRAKGSAILLISSDMEEIVELSDRAVVMFQGRIKGELSKSEISQTSLMNASFNVHNAVAEGGDYAEKSH